MVNYKSLYLFDFKKYKTIIILFVIFTFPYIGNTQNISLDNTVLELHLKKFRWMEQLNLDSLSMLLDENVAYIHSNGWKETKEEVIHNLASGKLKYISVNIHESDVRIWNSTAVVTGKGLFIVSLDGKPIEINLFYTEVYTIKEEGIFLVSRHACRY